MVEGRKKNLFRTKMDDFLMFYGEKNFFGQLRMKRDGKRLLFEFSQLKTRDLGGGKEGEHGDQDSFCVLHSGSGAWTHVSDGLRK